MITHAYVRYIEDNEQAVVAIKNIKDFQPRGPEDFNDKAKYNIKWGSDDEYYKARILLLGGKLACKLFSSFGFISAVIRVRDKSKRNVIASSVAWNRAMTKLRMKVGS